MTDDEKEVHRMHMEQVENDCFIDVTKKIEHPPTAISMGSYTINTRNGVSRYPIPIGTYGNFSFISGQPKTKKSFLISLITSVFLNKTKQNRYGRDMMSHRGERCAVHFDTEQGDFHSQRVFRRPFEMNKSDDLGCYHTYALRRVSYSTRIDFIEYKLQQLHKDGLDIGLVIIDGIADLVSDVNNIEESNEVVQRIMTWSSVYNCHIMVVIHLNFGSEKSTGHLGSFLTKKCETELMLETNEGDDNIVGVKCKRSRNFSFKPFSFSVNSEGHPYVLDSIEDLVEKKIR